MRKLLATALLTIIFSGICFLFWESEWKYSLPTPLPKNYQAVTPGEYVNLTGRIASTDKPAFLHFFNPDCPCSRFNMSHFQSLVKKYGSKFTFVVVVMNKSGKYTADEVRDKYDLNIPITLDETIAPLCGVYSTPQAVVLDASHKLYFRGNYNKSRYCADPGSEYARMALDSFLQHHGAPSFDREALTAYGCQTNYCTK